MWLTNRKEVFESKSEEWLDRLLTLSPQITEGPVDNATLVSLASSAAYWRLAELLEGPQRRASANAHPLLESLEFLSREFGSRFVLAPTAPWALWLAERFPPQSLIESWDLAACRTALDGAPLASGRTLIADAFKARADAEREWEFFLESCSSLGVRTFGELLKLPHEKVVERFGPVAKLLIRRLQGADDLKLQWHKPSPSLEKKFHPAWEHSLGEGADLLESLQTTLVSWEKRLAARKSLLRGLRLTLRSERLDKREAFFVALPRPTRASATLFNILREKWFALAAASGKGADNDGGAFEDVVDELVIESMGIEREADAQLELFDPGREERNEKWGTLLGRLAAKSTQAQPIEVGTWRAFASYMPERAVEWIAMPAPGEGVAFIEEHPKRPLFLLREPVPFAGLHARSEEEFLGRLEAAGALSTIERLSDPWNGTPDERCYARFNGKWIFWSRAHARTYLHGYFEEPLAS